MIFAYQQKLGLFFLFGDRHKSTLKPTLKHNAEGQHKTPVRQVDSRIICIHNSKTWIEPRKTEYSERDCPVTSIYNRVSTGEKGWHKLKLVFYYTASGTQDVSPAQEILHPNAPSTGALPRQSCWNPLPSTLQSSRCTMNFTLKVTINRL